MHTRGAPWAQRSQPGLRSGLLLATAVVLLAGMLVVPVAEGEAASTGEVVGVAPPATGGTDYESVVGALNKAIPQLMAEQGAVGLSIALVDGKRTIMARGYGYADKKAHRKVSADTLFHIGSTSKTFAALAVMQLVQRGLVELDAPVSTYVPSFRLATSDPANPITVRSILDHHSGIPGDVFNGMITTRRPNPGFGRWLLGALPGMFPERPVNEVYAYNNAGFALLDHLVRNVSGLPLDSYARRHLFSPMGMKRSTFDDREPSASRITTNYEVSSDSGSGVMKVTTAPREYVNAWAAGSILSSANDMSSYLKVLLGGGAGRNGRVVKAATLRQMWTPQVAPELDIAFYHFGLGFAVGDGTLDAAGPVIWHDGATQYNFSMLKLLPGSDLAVFVSENTANAGGVSGEVATLALRLALQAKTGAALGVPHQLPAAALAPVATSVLAAQAGTYAGSGALYEVAAAPGGLQVTAGLGTGQATNRLFSPGVDGWYRSPESQTQLSFAETSGRHLMLTRMDLGAGPATLVMGQRVPGGGIPAGWGDRLGDYREVNLQKNTAPGLSPTEIRVEMVGSVPVAQLGSGPQALVPGPAGSLCTVGLAPSLGRGMGDCLIPLAGAGGSSRFTFLGVKYKRG